MNIEKGDIKDTDTHGPDLLRCKIESTKLSVHPNISHVWLVHFAGDQLRITV